MRFQAIGDLAAHLSLRGHNARVTSTVDRLSDEIASGRIADLSAAVRGNFRPLAQITHSLEMLSRYDTATATAAMRSSAEQIALARVQDGADRTVATLLTAGNIPDDAMLDAAAAAGAAAFRDAVSALNGSSAGEALFAGVATDGAALAPADTMLADLAVAVAAETTGAGVHAVVAAWFNDAGGGYETTGYLGDPVARAPSRIGDGVTVAAGPTALDPAIRAVLAPLAMLALDEAGVPTLGIEERAALASNARGDLLNATAPFTALRADTGAREAKIERQQTANAAETSALEIARSEITDVDPYETAIELEAAAAQLEVLYTVTGRLSQLTLVNFLR